MKSTAAPDDLDTPAHANIERTDRLESWKEIAGYLRRGVTTVQRWEREENLPVHRHQHDSLGSVYAYKFELEAWRANRVERADKDEQSQLEPRIRVRDSARLWPTVQGIAALSLAAAIGGGVVHFLTPAHPADLRRLAVVLPSSAPIVANGTDRTVAITPEGKRIIYVGGSPASRKLFVRPFDQLAYTPIPNVLTPRYPFVSPDEQWIGFFEGFTLKKVRIVGGLPTIVAVDNEGSGFYGASWGPNNKIAVAVGGRLMQVSADGGTLEPLTVPDETKEQAVYRWPQYLPDGQSLLFTVVPFGDWGEKDSKSSLENARVALLDLRTGYKKILIESGTHARYIEPGYLVYAASGTLRAVPFDSKKLAVVGSSKVVLPDLEVSREGAANFDVARDGTLVYTPGGVQTDLLVLTWVDRHGQEQAVGAPPLSYRNPRLSPDGTRVAFGSLRDLGIWDLTNKKFSWFGVGPASNPVWTPDGRDLIFSAIRGGVANIYIQAVNGSHPLGRLTDSRRNQYPYAVSPDGKYLVFREDAASADLMLLDLVTKNHIEPLIQTPGMDMEAALSPDGRLVTYQTDSSGQQEVYVQPFPNSDNKHWKVSNGGGSRPTWAHNGRELFYISPRGDFMTVPVERQGETFTVGRPTALFEGPFYLLSRVGTLWSYEVSLNGDRFLMTKPEGSTGSVTRNIEVVLNWNEELRRMVSR
jgi:hypothetical protein